MDESVLGSMKAVKEGRMGVNRVALEHNMPRATLNDLLIGKSDPWI